MDPLYPLLNLTVAMLGVVSGIALIFYISDNLRLRRKLSDMEKKLAWPWSYFDPVAISNIYTMSVSSKHDKRQTVPTEMYKIPSHEVRTLRARLILEEALETIHALGLYLFPMKENGVYKLCPKTWKKDWYFLPTTEGPNLEGIIDGCCDTIYVTMGALIACGAVPYPHLVEVCQANDNKFPDGRAIVDASGKYQKPPGWKGPDHEKVMNKMIVRAGQMAYRGLLNDLKIG